ncbi:protein kinase domain-containing protein [Sorangium sp. So ce1024]|uniref:serine/threonine-protein kinase n=1 Tax=Sorangium sp. So ce1024 TaxID=3133327 RepID=UPI003F0328AB
MSTLKAHPPAGAGTTIHGKYRLVAKIGEGAMGSVWSAINIATGREVALKRVIRAEPELRIRLEREARSCGALQHRNIVDVYDMVETDAGEPLLVMQLLSGETLADLLLRRRRVEPEIGAGIGRDVARGLAAVHALHIVHRDLKPSNIFLHREPGVDGWVVKVLDFGVAKNLSINDGLHTMPGGMVGSPLYMSPEQVRADRSIDHRTDIWTLGVVLFEMLTGERPFRGDAREVFAAILTGEIPTLDRVLWRADRRLVDVVARCMRRDREERFGTAAEVAELLDRIATGRGALPSGPEGARGGPEAAQQQAVARGPISAPPSSSPASGAHGTAGATDAEAPAASHRRDPGSSTTPLITSSPEVSRPVGVIPPGAPAPSTRGGGPRRKPRVAAVAAAMAALGVLIAAAMVLPERRAQKPPEPVASGAPAASAHERSGEPELPPLRPPEPREVASAPSMAAPPVPSAEALASPRPARAEGDAAQMSADGAGVVPEPIAPVPSSKPRVDARPAGASAQDPPLPRRPPDRPPKADPCAGKKRFEQILCRDKQARARSPHAPL